MLENTELLEVPPEYPMEPERLSPSIVLLFPFIVGAISVTAQIGWNYVVNGFGILCVVVFGFDLIRGRLSMPREVAIFMCFLLWTITGIFSAYSAYAFLTKFSTMLQFFLMAFLISHFTRNTKMARVLLFAVLTGAMVMGVAAVLSGDYRRTEEAANVRLEGLTRNSNAFSIAMTYATGIMLYFFKTAKSRLVKGVYVVAVLAVARLVLASGSRAGFISFSVLCSAWFCLSYIREIKEKPAKTLGMFILLIIGMVVLFLSLSSMLIGNRLNSLTDYLHGGRGDTSIAMRHEMVQKGIAFIKEHPVTGIGLGQYGIVSGEIGYSHNNYIEIFSSTGIIGGLIYYSIYIALYLRLRRLGKMVEDIKDRELVCLGKTIIIIMFLSDVPNVSYYNKQHWIQLAIFIGWAFHIERELTSNNAYISAEDEFAVTEYR
jgi:O-antigen ligase